MAKAYVKHDYTVTGRDYVETEGGEGGGGVNYSTEEHVIGTWTDGSTLYEKTIFESPTWENKTTAIALGANDTCKDIKGGVTTATGADLIPFGYTAAGEYVRCYQSGSSLSVYNEFYSSRSYVLITIQYVKTE